MKFQHLKSILNIRRSVLVAVGVPLLGTTVCSADLQLPAEFSDHMVLQRGAPVPVWGSADAGANVAVEFAGQAKSAHANSSGQWRVTLDPLNASATPAILKVQSGDAVVRIADVLVGEVWLAGGQSNMGFPLSAAHNAAETLPAAQDPQLRFLSVNRATAAEPQRNVKAAWALATPDSAKSFSAVAYFFAREIRKDQKCPVAILQAPWGGTPIETWISLEGIERTPPLEKTLAQWEKALEQYRKVQENPKLVSDYQADLKKWHTEVEPGFTATMKEYNAAKAAGKSVGEKPKPSRPEPQNPDPMAIPSPSKRPQTPSVSFNGMIAPLIPYAIRGVIWYQGEANGSAGLEYRKLFPRLIEDWRALWKQSSAETAADFPFLFVQLPGCGSDPEPVALRGSPWLREAQTMTLRLPGTAMAITIDIGNPQDPHPIDKVDVGQRLALLARKHVYGESIVASGPLYQGYSVEPGGKVRVRFTETGTGLTVHQPPWYAAGVKPYPADKPIGFFIAGDDKKWVEAEAAIDGESVLVSSPRVPKPAAVRYGWANSPRCNLYNKEGLPASPFRTDDWP